MRTYVPYDPSFSAFQPLWCPSSLCLTFIFVFPLSSFHAFEWLNELLTQNKACNIFQPPLRQKDHQNRVGTQKKTSTLNMTKKTLNICKDLSVAVPVGITSKHCCNNCVINYQWWPNLPKIIRLHATVISWPACCVLSAVQGSHHFRPRVWRDLAILAQLEPDGVPMTGLTSTTCNTLL